MVPRELVRYVLEGGGKQKEEGSDLIKNKEKDSKTVVIGDTGQGWASCIACVAGSSRECARPKDDIEEKTTSDRWQLPWRSGETPEKKSDRPS